MRPTRFKRPHKRTRRRLSARDGYRAVLAALLLLFVFAAVLTDGGLFSSLTKSAQRTQASAPRAPTGGAYGDDELRTGSILFVPKQGNVCRQRLIDNATWKIWDNGFVICDEAVSWNAAHGPRYTATSRIEAISDGFFPKRQ